MSFVRLPQVEIEKKLADSFHSVVCLVFLFCLFFSVSLGEGPVLQT